VIYRVVITARAKSDLRQYYQRAARHASHAATSWLRRFEAGLKSLSKQPHRCQIALESARVEQEVREYLFGRGLSVYRALFVIASEEVRILHIRWAGRDVAEPDELLD